MWRTLLLSILCLVLSSPTWAQSSASAEASTEVQPKLKPGDEYLTFIVSKAIRGDILQLDSGKELKLIGVKSPDLATPNSSAEYFSKESLRYTSKIVKGKEVKVTFERRKTDSAGRWLGYVWLEGDELLNAKIVREGYGIPENPGRIPNEEIREAITSAFQSARVMKAGMWSDAEKVGELLQGPDLSAPPDELTAAQRFELETTAGPPPGPPTPGTDLRPVSAGLPPPRPPRQATYNSQPPFSVWNQPVFNQVLPQPVAVPNVGTQVPVLQPAPQSTSGSRNRRYDRHSSRTSGKYNLNYNAEGKIIGLTPAGPISGYQLYTENQRVPVDRGEARP